MILTPDKRNQIHKAWSEQSAEALPNEQPEALQTIASIVEAMLELFGPDFDPMPTLIVLNQMKMGVQLANTAGGVPLAEAYGEAFALYGHALISAWPYVADLDEQSNG